MPRLTHTTALVLVAVHHGFRYGFDILEATGLPSGTVYPILRRLEDAGLLRSRWEDVRAAREEQRPPRRYYQLTGTGADTVRVIVERFPGIERALGAPAPRPRPA
jgi:DNA-binding PadR family transcriptional regulator